MNVLTISTRCSYMTCLVHIHTIIHLEAQTYVAMILFSPLMGVAIPKMIGDFVD